MKPKRNLATQFATIVGISLLFALGAFAWWRQAQTPRRIDDRALAVLRDNHRLMTSAPALSGEITTTYSASAGPLRRRVWLEKPNRARIVLQYRFRSGNSATGKWLPDYEPTAEVKVADGGGQVKTFQKRPRRPYVRTQTETTSAHGAGILPYDASPLFGFFDANETHWSRIEGGGVRDLDYARLDAPNTWDGVSCRVVTYRTSLKPTPVPLLDVALGRASWRTYRSARNPPVSAYHKEVTLFVDAQGVIRRSVTRDSDPYVSGTIVRTEDTRKLRVGDVTFPPETFRFPPTTPLRPAAPVKIR